ncbi:MAG: molybdopterin-dependent oxidoreductase, partial [Marmoricola sp.]
YAWSKFARVAIGTNNIDFRARELGADQGEEEAAFLASTVALTAPGNGGVTYTDLEGARTVLLAGLEPEDEAGTIFLRLRKGNRARGTRVFSIAAIATRGLGKVGGTLLPTVPGGEAAALAGLSQNPDVPLDADSVILVGERLATVPGALSAAAQLAASTGARLAWVPRRAGDRGAVETGCLPGLLPGGRPVADASARVDLAAAWGLDALPEAPGLSTSGIISGLASGDLAALVVGGVDPSDVPLDDATTQALRAAFVVSLEVRSSAFTELADVVLPVAPSAEKSGTFVSWEGRVRPFPRVIDAPGSLPDVRVLAGIAEELGRSTGLRTPEQAWAEMTQVGPWEGARPSAPTVAAGSATAGPLVLSSWKQSVDDGRMQDGDEHYLATARPAVAIINQATLDGLGLTAGDRVTLSGPLGSATLPVAVGDVVDGAVWAPASTPGLPVRRLVGPAGSTVTLQGGTK